MKISGPRIKCSWATHTHTHKQQQRHRMKSNVRKNMQTVFLTLDFPCLSMIRWVREFECVASVCFVCSFCLSPTPNTNTHTRLCRYFVYDVGVGCRWALSRKNYATKSVNSLCMEEETWLSLVNIYQQHISHFFLFSNRFDCMVLIFHSTLYTCKTRRWKDTEQVRECKTNNWVEKVLSFIWSEMNIRRFFFQPLFTDVVDFRLEHFNIGYSEWKFWASLIPSSTSNCDAIIIGHTLCASHFFVHFYAIWMNKMPSHLL